MRIGGVVLAGLGVALTGLSFLSAQELRGRMRQSYQSLTTGDTTTDSVLQTYEVSFKNNVTPSTYWQARLRALLTGFDQSGGASSDTALYEPFLQVVYEGPEWELSGGSRMTRVGPKGDLSTATHKERRDLFGRLAWSREDLPRIDWSVYRIDIESDQIRTSTEDRSLLTGAFARGPGNVSLGMENRLFTDPRSDFTRDSVEVTGNGDLRGSFASGRVTLGGQALAVRWRVVEETPRALDVDVLRRPRSGLFGEDTTPLTGSLADTPSLVDADFTTPAADLSGDFRNIGVDFGFPETVETVHVTIERRLLPGNDRDYRWDVYTSADGDFWTLLASPAPSSFDGLLNRFEIRFGRVTTRYLKVVNTDFSRNEPPLAATEIQVFGRETRSGRERRTQTHDSGNATVTWRAAERLDLSLNTFASRQTTGAGDGETADADLNSTLTTTVRPRGSLTTTMRLQAINRSSTLGRPEADRIAAATLAAAPLPGLDLSVSGTHRRNTSYGDLLVQADSVNVRGAARFLHDVETALDLGVLHQDEGTLGRSTTRRSARVSLATTLRPGLFVSGNWGAERVVSASRTGSLPDRIDIDLRSRLSYRPTRVLGAAVEVLYQDIAGLKGTSRLYDLDWLPFPGGAMQAQFTLRQDRRSVTGNLRDEARAGLRWTLNPRTLLDLAYSVIRSGPAGAAARQEVVSAFLEYRF